MSIKRIVPDLTLIEAEGSRAFYSDLLGLDLAMDLGWVMTFVSPDNPAAQITLSRRDATAPVDPSVTVEVTDVDAVYRACVGHGLAIVYPLTDEPWGVRRFFVRDPNGLVLNVMGHPERGE